MMRCKPNPLLIGIAERVQGTGGMISTTPDYHNSMEATHPDRALVRTFLETVTSPDAPFEVRVLNTRYGGPANLRSRSYSGFFDCIDPAVEAVCRITGSDAAGVYVTLNPLANYVLNWNHNALSPAATSAGDDDVLRLRFLYLDFDPVRPRCTCATSTEHRAAKIRANEVAHVLMTEYGFPLPAWAGSSGSGTTALWRIDLPPEDRALIVRVLSALAARHSDDGVKIDTGVHNPARLVRIAGTLNAKSATPQPDRPWRHAIGKAFGGEIVSREQLETIAALAPNLERREVRRDAYHGTVYDLRKLLEGAGVEFTRKERDYATLYELSSCLTSDDHDSGASLIQFPSGAVAYRCLHDSCSGKSWADVKHVLGVPEYRTFPTIFPTGNGNWERSRKGGAFQAIRIVNGKVTP